MPRSNKLTEGCSLGPHWIAGTVSLPPVAIARSAGDGCVLCTGQGPCSARCRPRRSGCSPMSVWAARSTCSPQLQSQVVPHPRDSFLGTPRAPGDVWTHSAQPEAPGRLGAKPRHSPPAVLCSAFSTHSGAPSGACSSQPLPASSPPPSFTRHPIPSRALVKGKTRKLHPPVHMGPREMLGFPPARYLTGTSPHAASSGCRQHRGLQEG